jgi:hypothetical protein
MQKLTLEKDGKYSQEVRLRSSDKLMINTGMWKYSRAGERENCLEVGDGFGRIRPDFDPNRGGCSFPSNGARSSWADSG